MNSSNLSHEHPAPVDPQHQRLRITSLGRLVIICSLAWLVFGTAYCSHRWTLLQFVVAPLFFGMLIAMVLSLVLVFLDWGRIGWRSMLPFFICVVSLIGSFALAVRIREQIFEWSLPSYEAVVQQMQSGELVVTTNALPRPIPEAVPRARLAYYVAASRDTNGVLVVAIITEGGFPVSHSGYLYSSSGTISPESAADKFYHARLQVRPHWFYVTY